MDTYTITAQQLRVLRLAAYSQFGCTLAACGIGWMALKRESNLRKQYQKLWNVTKYLASVVDDHGICLSEFDLIALRELGLVVIEGKNV